MKTRLTVFIGVLLGFALLAATSGQLIAQESTPETASAGMGDEAAMMQGTTPEAGSAEMAEKMDRMMDQCLAMMEMMSMMMGGDMSGMMGGEGMQGMEGMEDMPAAAATPEP